MQRSTMTLTSAVVLGGLTAIAVVVSACGGQDANGQATSPSATAYPQGGYYPQQQPYPQQQAYPQQQQYPQQPYPQQPQPYPQQPQPTAYPTAPATAAPTAAGTMATPGPLAMACTADSACGLHKCNTQYSKCAFPCASAVDCSTGTSCTMGICTPAIGGH